MERHSIRITFRHSRNLFNKELFKGWVYRVFDFTTEDEKRPIRFEGCEHGNNYPIISMSLMTFENVKNQIPESVAKNIVRIRGIFNVLEFLTFGVNDFDNDLRDESFMNRVESYHYIMRNK